MQDNWRTRDLWTISLSACFADLGYQAILAGFPIFLVIVLKAPVWAFGLTMALSYGGGSLFSYWGGRLGDRVGHRRVAVWGNAFIPLMSLAGLLAAPVTAIAAITLGWWSRNFRSPSRRQMLTQAVDPGHRTQAFGFLHALDVGGGMLAAVYVLLMLAVHAPFRWIFLLTILPLAASTTLLGRAKVGQAPVAKTASSSAPGTQKRPVAPQAAATRAILLATALYGLSSFTVGFPVLTLARESGAATLGIVAFLVYQGVSALTGYVLGGRLGRTLPARYRSLGLWGYFAAAIGSGVLAYGSGMHLAAAALLVGVAILGFAFGVIETLEPSLISVLSPGGRGFGSLSASRSVGLFVANLAMGLLYVVGPGYAYGYAGLVALLATLVLWSGRRAVQETPAPVGSGRAAAS